MKDKFEDLNDTFDITPVESEVVKEPKKPDKVSKSWQSLQYYREGPRST